ncbi:MAG: hypothetical protein ACRD8Z_07725 [Nitrososphaeraceae archaeon]
MIGSVVRPLAWLELFKKNMIIVNPGYDGKKHGVLFVTSAIIPVSLFALSLPFLSGSTLQHHTTVTEAYAQPSVETVKHRDLTIDLDNGLS